jgi:hypothetical protein
MKNQFASFVFKRRQQRKQRTPFPLLTPVHFLLLLLGVCISATAEAQCYVDPLTGQQICMRHDLPCQPPARPSRRLVSDDDSPSIDSTAHCRISVADGTSGSGTLVACNDSIALVLTCSHLFDTCKSHTVVSFAHGGRFNANLIEVDRANDLAALAIQRPEIKPLVVSDAEPAGLLTACGFGPNGVFRCVRGRLTGHPTAAGATYPSTTIAGAVRPGDSGGGVLDTNGDVIGVVWGQRDGQTYATCGRPVREFFHRVRNKLFGQQPSPSQSVPTSPQPPDPSPTFDWQAWTNELDARIRALDAKKQDKGDYLRPGDLNSYLRIDDASKITGQFHSRSEIENKLKSLFSQFESVQTVIESVRQHVEQITVSHTGFLEGVSLGKFAVATLGLSGPIAAAVLLAGGLFGRRIKSRLGRLEANIGISALDSRRSTLDRVVAVDSPPPPQRTVPETHYVPVEKDSFAKAHQWASEHVARKYPGATEVLQTQDSLIKQYLAGK